MLLVAADHHDLGDRAQPVGDGVEDRDEVRTDNQDLGLGVAAVPLGRVVVAVPTLVARSVAVLGLLDVSAVEVRVALLLAEVDGRVERERLVAARVREPELRGLELRSMFSGEHDERDALCTIQAGEGGADA